MADTADILRQYYGDLGPEALHPTDVLKQAYADNPFALGAAAAPARTYRGEARNLPPRPSDAMAPVAEAISPTMGGYGVGQLLGDTYGKGREGDYWGAAGNLPMLAAAAMPVPGAKRFPHRIENPIRAYHGSPHDFDKFELGRIGSGEGAQVYGHGLYFAEHEPVARKYRDKLADRPDVIVGGEVRKPATDIFAKNEADATVAARLSSWAKAQAVTGGKGPPSAAQAFAHVSDDIERGMSMAQRRGDFDLWSSLSQQQLALQRFSEQGLDFANKGHMYEVGLHARPEEFLDWDKPLKEQSDTVRQRYFDALSALGGPTQEKLGNSSFTSSGESLHNLISAWSKHDPEQTATALGDVGIPGVRYLDQGSRAAGIGTRNYSVWTPGMIEILRKYGIVGPIAGAAGLSQYDSMPPKTP